jgi:hypothetical protein
VSEDKPEGTREGWVFDSGGYGAPSPGWYSQTTNSLVKAISIATQVNGTLAVVQKTLTALSQKVDQVIMSQADIDAQVQAISTSVGDINSAVSALQTEIANLQAAGVNTAGLDAAVSSLQAATSNLGNLANPPAPPAPPAT